MAFDWTDAGAGAASGALAGASLGPVGAAVGGVVGGVFGGFSSKDTPQYVDPNHAARQVAANNLLSAKTGEDYAAVQRAGNAARGKELYGDISRDWSGNPAVASGLYNKVERNVEGENQQAGVEGARINESNQKAGADLLTQDSDLGFREWTANTNRAAMPTPLETMATQGIGQLVGKGVSKIGGGTPGGTSSGSGASGNGASGAGSTGEGDDLGGGDSMG